MGWPLRVIWILYCVRIFLREEFELAVLAAQDHALPLACMTLALRSSVTWSDRRDRRERRFTLHARLQLVHGQLPAVTVKRKVSGTVYSLLPSGPFTTS